MARETLSFSVSLRVRLGLKNFTSSIRIFPSSPPRSIRSSTITVTSSRDWGTRATGISGRDDSALGFRPFARQKSVVLAALDFFHEIAKRFQAEHAAASRFYFRV